MKKFLEEFKAFAMRANVLDMAVGVVIGSAFTAIVNSLVADIITPLLSLLTRGINLAGLSIALGQGEDAANWPTEIFCRAFSPSSSLPLRCLSW